MRNSLAISLASIVLTACSGPSGGFSWNDRAPRNPSIDITSVKNAVPRVEARSKYGNPPSYTVRGKTYYVSTTSDGYLEHGIASWYGTKFHGNKTSSGELYNMYAMTAAHKTLPLPTYAEVTNMGNGRSIIVRINDRGPFHDNRLIDLSYVAARKLGITAQGTALVEVRAIDPRNPERPVKLQAKPGGVDLYLQVGAFVSRFNAERLKNRLQSQSLTDIKISQTQNENTATIYQVRIGPIADVASADKMALQLNALGIQDPHVVLD